MTAQSEGFGPFYFYVVTLRRSAAKSKDLLFSKCERPGESSRLSSSGHYSELKVDLN